MKSEQFYNLIQPVIFKYYYLHNLFLIKYNFGVVIIKNPVNIVVPKIRLWLEDRDYDVDFIYVVDSVYICIFQKLSEKHIEEFKKDFNCDISLNEVTFHERGNSKIFEYVCNHTLIREFKAYLLNWLDENEFPVSLTTISSKISIRAKKLANSQISKFEKEFEVGCVKYSVSCGGDTINYEFE